MEATHTPRGTSRVHRNRDNAVAVASQIPATTGRPAAVIDLEDYALFTSPPADVLMTAEIEFKAHQAATFGVLD